MQNRFLLRYRLHHLFFWMLVFGAWYFFRVQDYSSETTALKVTLVKVVDLAIMVYITNYILLPYFLYKKRWVIFIVLFLLLICSSSILKMNILGRVLGNPALFSLAGDLKARIYDNVIPHFFLVLAGAAIKLMFDYTALQQRMAETARERAEAELNFLKSQINPHFLFNSLNTVYFMIEKENEKARTALHKFSEMLRYQLYETGGAPIKLEREIAYINDYIGIQRLRREATDEVTFTFPPATGHITIEPLLLIPFVENAFKHVSSGTGKHQYVRVTLQVIDDGILFQSENSVNGEATSDTGSGIGLKNLRRRLELLYPGRHKLEFVHNDHNFKASLILKLR